MSMEFYADLWRLAAVAVAIAVAAGLLKWFKVKKSEAREWKAAGLSENKLTAPGIVFGKNNRGNTVCSPAADEGHCVVLGSSGCGKTSALLIPTLRAWTGNPAAHNTAFSIDISGDISANVSCSNKLVFEPGSPESVPYNVFAAIDSLLDDDLKDEALEQLALLLLPDEPNASPTAKFWRDGARKMLTATLVHYYHEGFDFNIICQSIVGQSYVTLLDSLSLSQNCTVLRYVMSFSGAKPDVLASFKAGCDDAVRLIATNKKVGMAMRRPRPGELAITPAVLETHNVFLVVPDDKLRLYAPMMSLITGQMLEYFATRPDPQQGKILFALDEFASLKLDITDALRKLRKKGIRIMICTQSLADIDATLGVGAHRTLLNNFRHMVIMSVLDADSQEYLARMIGREQKTKRSQTARESHVISETWSTEKDYIIEPTLLGRLGDDLLLIHPNGWSRLKKNYYFKP